MFLRQRPRRSCSSSSSPRVERFYIYASRKWAGINGHDSRDIDPAQVPTGVIVGTAKIARCERHNGHPRKYEWHLTDVRRLPPRKQRKPTRQPQPVWFNPF
jgi:hypothetical protein